MATLLSATALSIAYGPIKAVRDVSFGVEEGETIAIVGANGAGKSTIMRALSGVVPLAGGTVTYDGRPLAGRTPHDLVRAGIVHVPEGRGTIRTMTVRENLRLAYDMRGPDRPFERVVDDIIGRFPRLGERLAQPAGNLSGGEQQMLALARSMVKRPRLLLVDEPSLGLSPLLTREAFAVLAGFQKEGVTILIVEQNVRSALALAHRGYVLRTGALVATGTSAELLEHPGILSQYLGIRSASVDAPTGPAQP
jgi:branched-chain amino acid transport system ATP-binding protein